MKKASKILSVALVIVMAVSMLMLPSSALTLAIDAEVTATKVAEQDGLGIYKIGVYVDSNLSLIAVQLNLSYDNNAFQLVRPNTYSNAAVVNANMVIDKADPELVVYDGDAYQEYEGAYTGDNVNPDYGYAMFPNDGTQPSLSKLSDTNLGSTLLDKGYAGVYWAWMVDVTDNYLLISGGDQRGTESPLSGRAKLLTFYLKERAGAAPGDYEIGFNADQYRRLTGTYSTNDEVDSIIIGPGSASIRPENVTYKNATVTLGEEAGPVVAKSKAEVKMTPNSPTTVEDAFQFRVTSVITDADWDTYFANTAAGGNNAITKLGFVAYKGTDGFDLETAKSVAKGGTAAGYDKAETTYVQKETDSSDAYFGAIIKITSAETRSDATYIAYVEYTDAEGATQYAFYDAAQTALLDTNYQAIVNAYLAAHPFSVG